MNLNEITSAISAWAAAKQNSATLISLFNEGNAFNFNWLQENVPLNSSMHVYPGIHNNQLWFFTIPSVNDTREQYESREGILPFITSSPITMEQPDPRLSLTITPDEAMHRIHNWTDNYDSWLTAAVTKEDGIFSAFDVPIEDVEYYGQIRVFMALENVVESEDFTADLILQNTEGGSYDKSFHDTVRPVPPFGGGNFFLLTL